MQKRSPHISELEDPDLTLERMFELWPETVVVFVERALLCVGCPVSPFHTVADTCREYHLDESAFRAELRRIIDRCPETDPNH